MRFHIPIRLPSLANISHNNWRRTATLAKRQKRATKRGMDSKAVPPLPLLITLTRVGPRKLDDDNLAHAFKYVRDQIAAVVGTDDGSNQYTWRYEQRRGDYGVDVEIVER
jgi:hypothetical protein